MNPKALAAQKAVPLYTLKEGDRYTLVNTDTFFGAVIFIKSERDVLPPDPRIPRKLYAMQIGERHGFLDENSLVIPVMDEE